jgi:serine/threonine-protein kinase
VVDEGEFVQRFSQEALAVAQLDHPNIVPVYDFEQMGDLVYLVMKYVEGGTLKGMLTNGQPLDLELAVDLTSQIGSALGYAHKRGVIHRDVKPSNVLIAEGPWALLTDFGLAKIIAGDRKLTRSGIGMGTPDYMSPEQAQGFPLDQRADLYSLGATLYEMVTGRVPFDAESSMAVVVKHMTEPPAPPRTFNPKLPIAVERVILKVMEKDPDQRYQHADEFISALTKALRQPQPYAVPDLASVAPEPSRLPGNTVEKMPGMPEGQWTLPAATAPEPESLPPQAAVAARPSGLAGLWSQKLYRIALIIGAVLIVPFLCSLLLVAWGLWQSFGATPVVSTLTLIPSITPLPATATYVPTDTPLPAPTDTPVLSPTPEPSWVFISSDTPVRVGMYVKAVKPEGVILGQEAGFDKPYIATLPQDSILYVLAGPVSANDLLWIRLRDQNTGRVGWARQDSVAAYAIPVRPTPTP